MRGRGRGFRDRSWRFLAHGIAALKGVNPGPNFRPRPRYLPKNPRRFVQCGPQRSRQKLGDAALDRHHRGTVTRIIGWPTVRVNVPIDGTGAHGAESLTRSTVRPRRSWPTEINARGKAIAWIRGQHRIARLGLDCKQLRVQAPVCLTMAQSGSSPP